MIDLMIIHGDLFTMEGPGVGYIADGAVAIKGQNIIDVGKTETLEHKYNPKKIINARNKAILPGLINGHVHSVLSLLRGFGQDTTDWIGSIAPFLDHMSPKLLQLSAKLSLLEAVQSGTTTFCDYSPGISDAVSIYDKFGVRAMVCSMISDVPLTHSNFSNDHVYPFDQGAGDLFFEENIELVKRWNGAADGRITVMIGPRAPDFCSTGTLEKVKRAAESFDLKIHMHICQDLREINQIKKRYGTRPVDFLDKIGYLNERLIAAHLIHCTDDEIRRIAVSGASMAFCPSTLILCDGIVPPADIFMESGGKICLGTDQNSPNNSTNLFNEMKAAVLSINQKRKDPEIMPTWKILRMATIEGAAALGLDQDIGSIKKGKKADVILIDLMKVNMVPTFRKPVRNIVPNLVLSATGHEVCVSIIDGKVVYEDYRFTAVDQDAILREIQDFADSFEKQSARQFVDRKTAHYTLTQNGTY